MDLIVSDDHKGPCKGRSDLFQGLPGKDARPTSTKNILDACLKLQS